MKKIKYYYNKNSRDKFAVKSPVDFITKEVIKRVRNFHKKLPNYEVTPLYRLNKLANRWNVNKIWVKDESFRFGLNAFKVLGSSYAIGYYLSQKLNIDITDFSFDLLKENGTKKESGDIKFVTATDGNHGRGVAWIARLLGQKAIVFMPKGSSSFRVNNIKKEGAEVHVTKVYYDETVDIATKYANDHNGVLCQDTAWKGYEIIPTWIMQGYLTIFDEILEQLNEQEEGLPTHMFLQAGVGSLAGSVQGHLNTLFGNERPITTIIEPHNAACLFKSAAIGNGNPQSIDGDLSTIMAGLSCGKPNVIAWRILRDHADMFISCPDYISAKGMRILGNPLPDDPQIISGESGAVSMGIIAALLQNDNHKMMVEKLKFNKESRILLISTEGDTDPVNYRNIVWDGIYASN